LRIRFEFESKLGGKVAFSATVQPKPNTAYDIFEFGLFTLTVKGAKMAVFWYKQYVAE
jgi:hypothetical protein